MDWPRVKNKLRVKNFFNSNTNGVGIEWVINYKEIVEFPPKSVSKFAAPIQRHCKGVSKFCRLSVFAHRSCACIFNEELFYSRQGLARAPLTAERA